MSYNNDKKVIKDNRHEIPKYNPAHISLTNDTEKNAMYSQIKNTGKFSGKLSSI